MTQLKADSNDWAKDSRKNSVRLAYWTGAWVLTMALANFGPKFLWAENGTLTVLAILLNLCIGIGMILAYRLQLKGLDELQQKIQLEAMALALGMGVVAGLAWANLDGSNLIAARAEISHLVILMSLTYLAGIFAGHRRYS